MRWLGPSQVSYKQEHAKPDALSLMRVPIHHTGGCPKTGNLCSAKLLHSREESLFVVFPFVLGINPLLPLSIVMAQPPLVSTQILDMTAWFWYSTRLDIHNTKTGQEREKEVISDENRQKKPHSDILSAYNHEKKSHFQLLFISKIGPFPLSYAKPPTGTKTLRLLLHGDSRPKGVGH